jgi:hypothetical protein
MMPQIIFETTLNHLTRHFTTEGYPVGLLSAFRPEDSLELNRKRSRELKEELRSSPWGYTKIAGVWRDESTGEEIEDESFLIIGKGCAHVTSPTATKGNQKNKDFVDTEDDRAMVNFLRRRSATYQQRGFITKNSKGLTFVLTPELEVLAGPFEKITTRELEASYGRLHGRGNAVFAFEDAPIDSNWLARMARLMTETS